MTLVYRDKTGKPLKGAALQAAILSEARNAYFARYPEQLAALKTASPEDSLIIEQSALDAGTRILGQSQRRGAVVRSLSFLLGAGCTAGLLALFVRPAYIPHAVVLGVGMGSSLAISYGEERG
jgi:hypothetical protein